MYGNVCIGIIKPAFKRYACEHVKNVIVFLLLSCFIFLFQKLKNNNNVYKSVYIIVY